MAKTRIDHFRHIFYFRGLIAWRILLHNSKQCNHHRSSALRAHAVIVRVSTNCLSKLRRRKETFRKSAWIFFFVGRIADALLCGMNGTSAKVVWHGIESPLFTVCVFEAQARKLRVTVTLHTVHAHTAPFYPQTWVWVSCVRASLTY